MQYLHAANFTEGRHPFEGIVSESNGNLSRDEITIGASQTISPGSVLGKITATGAYVAWNPAASDGSQNAAAIAIYPAVTGSGATATIAALTRDAEFRSEALMWASGITAGNITTGIAQLALVGLIIRTSIPANR
jgi:hypothetical protein